MLSIIQIVDTIFEPLLRQLSPISRSMPGGRQRRDTKKIIGSMFKKKRYGDVLLNFALLGITVLIVTLAAMA
jgi:hypothetical protein